MMKITHTLSLVLILLYTRSAIANWFPEYYPEDGFEEVGIVDRVDPAAREIVLNDSLYVLPDYVSVHSLTEKLGSAQWLRKGTEVGFRTRPGERGYEVVVEVWLLPRGHIESLEAEQDE
jgi:hypothetical protein